MSNYEFTALHGGMPQSKDAQQPAMQMPQDIPVMQFAQQAQPQNLADANVHLQPTSIADLAIYGKGQVVKLPDFAEGMPFYARLRRPSMLMLCKVGKIPNKLLTSASELFTKGGAGLDADDENMMANMFDICEVICEAAMVEPTYAELKDNNIELTDEQIMAIFNYTQGGVQALASFR